MRGSKRLFLLSLLLILGLLLILSTGGCSKDGDDLSLLGDLPEGTEVPVELAIASEFALYRLEPVEIVPSIEHAPIAPDLSNVHVPMTLSAAQRERLAADGFVVSPGMQEKEFFTLYEKARYDNIPVFITSDSLLHVYHLLFSKTLRTAEAQYFYPLLKDLNQALAIELAGYYRDLES